MNTDCKLPLWYFLDLQPPAGNLSPDGGDNRGMDTTAVPAPALDLEETSQSTCSSAIERLMGINLEILVQEHATLMASQMADIAQRARSEEDIRHECNTLIDNFIKKAGLTVKGRHEYGLAGGRIDSKYSGVVIEYKDPRGAGKITLNKNAPGFKAVVKQILKRFQDLQAVEHVDLKRILGLGCDGETFVFVRMRGSEIDIEDPQPVTPHTAERLLRAVVSLGACGLSFTPENLADHFGFENKSAQESVRLIHNLIHETKNTKAQTFFQQWQILFGEVCGYDIHDHSTKIKKLADHYMVNDPNPSELLFAVHTYYAVFIKMLAAEIVASFSPLGISILKKLVSAPTSAKLREELHNLEQGGIWSKIGVRNFLEGDLFSWYLDAWNENCDHAFRAMIQSFDQFDSTTLIVDPTESRDLLKQLYQQLFPKSVRHDLGEYYTPDWLADLVLNELGYDGDPDKRLLDPACGSGTFLVMAINRVKIWYSEHRYDCGYGEDELLRKILKNIAGFDLNPLAVMAARTNFLMAIRDLLRCAGNIELPIYLCDSIMTPSEYGDLFTGRLGSVQQLKTSVGDFNIPTEVVGDRLQIGRYADTLESCIRDQYSPDEFLQQCKTEGIPTTDTGTHRRLYIRLQQLDKGNKNGVWARIIKNAFAPLFIGEVDYIVGNPPWVNWESLPDDYRKSTEKLWIKYDLFRHKGYKAKLGGGKDDVSILMTYVAHDVYLRKGGRLGFVITQSVFKTVGGGEGFRTFEYRHNREKWYVTPLAVHDLSDFQPFEGATNRTAVIVVKKATEPFCYPVPYTVWKKKAHKKIGFAMSLDDVKNATVRSQMAAHPIKRDQLTSSWLTVPKQALSGILKVIGQSDYKAYEGVNTGGLNGCFWIRILEKRPNGEVLIENLHDIGKIKVPHVQTVIEPDLIYPLLRGRDVQQWYTTPSLYIILANHTNKLEGIPEAEMKRLWPKTYSYLKRFEGNSKHRERGTLWGRSSSSVVNLMETGAFYSMFAVGPYTMSKWKVLWPEVGHSVRAGVCGPSKVEKVKPALPDHTIVYVSCNSEEEVYFVAGMLNSSPVRVAVASYIVLHPSPHVMQNIAIPRFDPKNNTHSRMANVSQRCHAFTAKGETCSIATMETEVDEIAAKIWGIDREELGAIHDALSEMGLKKTNVETSEEQDEE